MANPNLPISGKYNTYIGARYVPLMGGEWNQNKAYEPLVIVTHQGNSYTSNTFVPAGTDINDKTYWTLTGNYNGQVEQYRSEVQEVKQNVNQLNESLGDYNAQMEQYRSEVQEVKQNVNQLNESLGDYNAQMEQYRGEVQEVKQDVNQLTNSLGETNNNLTELENTVNTNETDIEGKVSAINNQLNNINNTLTDTWNKVVGTPSIGSFDVLLCTNGLLTNNNFNQYHETLTLDTILPSHLTYIIATNNDIMSLSQLSEFIEKNRVHNTMSKFYAFVYADENSPELIVNSHISFLYSNINNVTYMANMFPQVIGLKLVSENSATQSITQMLFKNIRNDIVTSLGTYTQSYNLNTSPNLKYTAQWHVTPDSVLCYGAFSNNQIPGTYMPENGSVIITGTPINQYVIASYRQVCNVMVKYTQNSQMYYTIASIYPLNELKFVLYPNSSSQEVSSIAVIKTIGTTNIIERFPSTKEPIEPEDYRLLTY